jgi:hypothetical protein
MGWSLPSRPWRLACGDDLAVCGFSRCRDNDPAFGLELLESLDDDVIRADEISWVPEMCAR